VALDGLRRSLPDCQFIDIDPEVAELRRLKSPLELHAIRQAAGIADTVLEAILPTLRPGLTENQVSARIACSVQELNAVCTLPPFVLSGNDNPTNHRDPSAKAIEVGETVMIDFLVAVNGYHADIARSVVVGSPSSAQLHAWQAVCAAHQAILDLIAPGVSCSQLQRVAASTLAHYGYSHPTRVGHGLGLGHSLEWPSLDSDARLLPGTTFCCEPRVNTPGTGVMKIEDDVVVTEDGYELLTHARRRLELEG
jgi:Xaa-Pro aminopeptidase/Xaa-Pro dipeptidase